MKRLRIAIGSTIALGSILILTGCSLSKSTKAAEAEVDRFHHRWNTNEFQAVYDDAHMNFRNAQSAEQLLGTFKAVKKNYGDLKSSNKRSWGFNSDKGVTDIKLSYDSAYDHGSAVEEFVFRMTDEKPFLLSYDIATPEKAAKRDEERKAAREEKRKAEEAERKAAQEARKAGKKP